MFLWDFCILIREIELRLHTLIPLGREQTLFYDALSIRYFTLFFMVLFVITNKRTAPSRGFQMSVLRMLGLLLLSRFSCVRLCATPQTAARQAPPSLGFSRQEHWSGLPFPSPIYEMKSESEVAQSCPTLSDPMDCSPPGSSVHGIFQARVPEWVAIAFSDGKTPGWTSRLCRS